MANTANSTLTTNFNVTPYYDDYDAGKGYYRLIFAPGRAVQARELTQMQTMLQKQIDRMGKHFFREGSIVLPGEFSIETDLDYVKIKDLDNANTEVTVANLLNVPLTGSIDGVQAVVVNVLDGTEASGNTKTLYVRYTSGSQGNTSAKVFAPNEVLTTNIGINPVAVSSSPTGKASRFIIRDGVFFAKEHFIAFETQSIIIGRYTANANCRVGFDILEEIITATQDTTLLDPALEASNYSAPGADRLKLTPTLRVRDLSDTTGAPDFAELFTIEDGVITELYDRPQYNILRDELAKRTLDESGDYYVRGLGVRLRENLDIAGNGGLSNTGNAQLLSVGVEPGLGYVKGYEVQKLVTDYININKATVYQNIESQIGTTTMGSYVILKEVSGAPVADVGSLVFLYDNAARSISLSNWNKVPTGNVIGTARVQTFERGDGTPSMANSTLYLYLSDVKMNGTNVFASTKSVFLNNYPTRSNLVGDIVLTSNVASLNDVALSPLLYPVGATATKTVRQADGDPSLQFNFLRTADVTVGAGGTFDLTLATYSVNGENMPYGTNAVGLSDSDKREIFLTFNQDVSITGSGTVTGTSNTTSVVGSGTAFTRFNVGDKFTLAGKSNVFVIASITSDTAMTTTENIPAGITGNAISKVYRTGDTIDLTGKGFDAGTERNITSTPSQLSFDLKETYSGGVSATVTHQVVRKNAIEVQKLLRASRYVKINCASSVFGTSGPYPLGVADGYRIRSITKKTSSFPASVGDGTDVTAAFTFDNGQRDQFYDFVTITPNESLDTTDRLLVELDFFEPSYTQGRGYFSIDSYPIDDTVDSSTTIRTENIPIFVSPRDNTQYNLRDFIDFRPVKAATANTAAISVSGATENPAVSSTFSYETNGLRLPVSSSQYTYDFSFYMPRRDLVVMDKDGFVSTVSGVPSSYPITPTTPENVMALASIFVTPYPSLAPNYGKAIGRNDLACVVKRLSNIRFTMRDIGLLKQRIENLEYYASLSLLEKAAADLTVLDENGLERFKNGIFVDTFSNHSLGDTANPNYNIVVDPSEKTIRPQYTMDSLGYDYHGGTSVQKTGDLITLSYTEVPYLTQTKVTSFRNVELSSYRYLGELVLIPETDVWVDTEYVPDEHMYTGQVVANTSSTTSDITWGAWQTEWNQWQTQVTGYEAYNSKGQLVGKYQTMADAQKPFDNDYGFVYATANTQVIQSTTGGYARVTNVYAQGQFRSSYTLTQGDGLIYAITSGTQSGVSTRSGSETFTTTTTTATETTEQIGTKVVDVSLVPYLRPQTLGVKGMGLKAFTKVFVYFDNENMSDYCRPISAAAFAAQANSSTVVWNPTNLTNSAEGDDLVTDEYGEVYFELRLPPEKRFRVGTKEVLVTDSPTNSVDASTKAMAYFVAAGLVQQKQNQILTTRGSSTSVTETTKAITDSKATTRTSTSKKFVGFVDDASCSAYSILPKAPIGVEGLFLTSVDLFFAGKSNTYGVWVEVREMDNAGGITRNQVPFSEVWLTVNDINVSANAEIATNIVFPSPIFLYNDVQYAFVIHTVAINPDTYLWVARLGETDINTGEQYSARPLTGTFYTTNNNLNWDIVPDVDLKINFYRASFTTGVTGQAILGNKPIENVILANVSNTITLTVGDTYVGDFRITTANASNLTVGNYVIGANSGANGVVTAINGNVVTVGNTRFVSGETLTFYSNTMTAKGNSSPATNIDHAIGRLKRVKYSANGRYARAEFVGSNGKMVALIP